MSFWTRIAFAVLILAATAVPQVAHQFSYQGYLTDSDGNPVADGGHLFVFALYDLIDATTPLWFDTMYLQVSGGQFNALLGSEEPLPLGLFSGPSAVHYLEVTVDGEVLSPRTFIGGQPYSGISKGVVGDSMSLGENALTFKGASSALRVGIMTKYGLAGTVTEDTVTGETLFVADDGGNVKAGSIQANGSVTSGSAAKDPQIVVDGPSQTITATSGAISFDNENLVTDGNIGIGTSSPAYDLHVVGNLFATGNMGTEIKAVTNDLTDAFTIFTGGADRFSIIANSSGTDYMAFRWVFGGNDVRIMHLTQDGRVGIGTAAPTQPLEVAGIVYSTSGGFKFPDGSVQTAAATGSPTDRFSRELMEDFTPLDAQQLLSSIAAMPVEAWNYKGTTEHHIGPVAEDFVAAFDVGTVRETDGQRENQYLAASDVAGVALAGVKELIERNRQLEAEVAQLKALVQQLVDQHK